MNNPGNYSNKRLLCLLGAFALIWLALAGHPAWSREPAKAGEKEKAEAPAPATPPMGEVAFIGKFTSPVKRFVVMPFQGIITTLEVQAGQQVKKDEVLAHYHLTPEAALLLQRRLSPPQVKDLEVKLAEVERTLSHAGAKRREVEQLAAKGMASKQAQSQVEKDYKLLGQQKQAIQKQLSREKKIAAEDLQVLRTHLGEGVGEGHAPQAAALKSPINGFVLFVHPDLRTGAQIEANTPVFQVGVMDPLVVKAQVHEMESLRVKVGDPADILPESLPGKKFEARVSRLSWVPMKPGLDLPTYYEAEFEVPNPDMTLKEGMKVRIVMRKPK